MRTRKLICLVEILAFLQLPVMAQETTKAGAASSKASAAKVKRQTLIPGCMDANQSQNESKSTTVASSKKNDEYQLCKVVSKTKDAIILEPWNDTEKALGLACSYELQPGVKITDISNDAFVKVHFRKFTGWYSADFDGMPMQDTLTKIDRIIKADSPGDVTECLLNTNGIRVYSNGYVSTQRGNGRLSVTRFKDLLKQINDCRFSVDSHAITPFRGSKRSIPGLPPPDALYRAVQYKQFNALVLVKTNPAKPSPDQIKSTTAPRLKLLNTLDAIQKELSERVPQRLVLIQKLNTSSFQERFPRLEGIELAALPKEGLLVSIEQLKELDSHIDTMIDGLVVIPLGLSYFTEGEFTYHVRISPDQHPVDLI